MASRAAVTPREPIHVQEPGPSHEENVAAASSTEADVDKAKRPFVHFVKREKLLAAIALLNPLSLIACFYTLVTDSWYTVEFSTTMFVTRGIFRVCTSSLGGSECHSNTATTDFVMGDCVRTAEETERRLNASLAMHVLGGLLTTFAWMLTAHGYRVASRDEGAIDQSSLIATINNGSASLCFLASTSIMSSTFFLSWYTCGKSYCQFVEPKRYCNEDMGNSLIAGYLSVVISFACFVMAGIRTRRERQRARQHNERHPSEEHHRHRLHHNACAQRPAAAAAKASLKGHVNASPRQKPAAARAAAALRSQPTGKSDAAAMGRLRRYFAVIAPDTTDAEISALVAGYSGDLPALWKDLVAEHGPELTNSQRRDIAAEKAAVHAFCGEHCLGLSEAEIARRVLAAFREGNGGFERMWVRLEQAASAARRGVSSEPQHQSENPVPATFPRGGDSGEQPQRSPESKKVPPRTQRRLHAAVTRSPTPELPKAKAAVQEEEQQQQQQQQLSPADDAADGSAVRMLPENHNAAATDWVLDPESQLLWSAAQQLYVDVASGEYFDPIKRKMWFNPRVQQWHVV